MTDLERLALESTRLIHLSLAVLLVGDVEWFRKNTAMARKIEDLLDNQHTITTEKKL